MCSKVMRERAKVDYMLIIEAVWFELSSSSILVVLSACLHHIINAGMKLRACCMLP